MISVWKCADCFHANKGEDDQACYWCNSSARVALHPVREPNQQQGTPSYEDLLITLKEIDDRRYTPIPVPEQIQALIEQYFREREKHTPPAGPSAEKGNSCQTPQEMKIRAPRAPIS